MTETQVSQFETSAGAQIFQIALNAFPGLIAFVYLVLVDDLCVLIDTGSNMESANIDLDQGFLEAGRMLGKPISFMDLTHIFISHAHIDHIAGLAYLTPKTKAKVVTSELDWKVVENYHERKVSISKEMRIFLTEAGLSEEGVQAMIDLYYTLGLVFDHARVDLTYQQLGMRLGPFRFLHVPGHYPGLTLIRLHDVVFTSDHVLTEITPHQGPERLSPYSGLSHYLDSLEKSKNWAKRCRLALPGHNDVIRDLGGRVSEIVRDHKRKLDIVLGCLTEKPDTIAGVSRQLFGETHGYNVLLAIEETGAHFEYLYQSGFIGISNLEEVERSKTPIAILYQCRRNKEELEQVYPNI